ncbi:MAG: chromosomal replication initiator protein DnaA [Deltaproteobacteria bacterium]|nr:chromosomal replication initiator protein DnaA [Deltaproteobacteria bacterium]
MTDKNNIWGNITSSIESDMSPSEFRTWFSRAELKELHPDLAVIGVPNKFVADWLRENYLGQLQKSFKDLLDSIPEIRFSYSGLTAPEDTPQYEATKKPASLSRYGLNATYKFSNFVTGNSNRFAYSAALQMTSDRLTAYNPLYIFSKHSSGKTHLLHAIGNHIITKNPSIKVRYLSVDQFSRDFSLAKKNGKLAGFRNLHKNLDLLLIDDVHLLGGRKKIQEELVTIYNLLYESKKQIVFAGKTPPAGINQLIPQLHSRLEWGLFTEISFPNRDIKISIIQEKAKQENIRLQEDVVFFLAKATHDLKTLVRYLVSLGSYFSLYKREIDISTVKSIISNRTPRNIPVYEIQRITANYFNLSVSDLLSNSRKQVFCYPRQIGMYLSRKLTGLSYKEIGRMFGNKDHSTVVYAVTSIKKAIAEQKIPVIDDINRLEASFS